MPFFVYKIQIEKQTRYIGHTNDIHRRSVEHNRGCFKKPQKKIFYEKVRETDCQILELQILKTFRTKTEAKRYEALLILMDYFGGKQLWQKVPNISDR
jgi:predicted GIY-YIG superfamily endonuclease